MSEANGSKALQIAKSIKRHFVNYICIALFGSICVIIGSVIIKAYLVKGPLDKAPSIMAANDCRKMIELIENSSRWEPLFPALKPRREGIAVRCYARNDQLGKAMGIADAMASMPPPNMDITDYLKSFVPPDSHETAVDRFAYFISRLEIPVAAGINFIFRKQNTALLIDQWSGYNELTKELKTTGDINSLEKLLSTAKTYHPDSIFTKELNKYMDQARALVRQGKALPKPPDPTDDAPFGWAIVRTDGAGVYDNSGNFIQKVTRGTLIEIDEIRDSRSGQIVSGSLYFRSNQKPDVVMRTKDLTLKRGLLFELDEQTLNSLLKRAELTRRISEEEESARARFTASNPYAAEFESARKEYLEFEARAKDLTEKHKTATGTEREKYFEELRIMKGKGIALTSKLKEIKAKYSEWIQANGNGIITTSPETATLKQQLAQVEEQLEQIGLL